MPLLSSFCVNTDVYQANFGNSRSEAKGLMDLQKMWNYTLKAVLLEVFLFSQIFMEESSDKFINLSGIPVPPSDNLVGYRAKQNYKIKRNTYITKERTS